MNRTELTQRVITVANNVLQDKKYVSPIDILLGIGYLPPSALKNWQQEKVPYLERVVNASLNEISWAMNSFRRWACENNLKPSQTAYMAHGSGPKRKLQFSKSGDSKIELAYCTHYISPLLSEKKQQNLQEKLQRPPEKVVFWTVRESQCSKCKAELLKGSFLFLDGDQPLCLHCAGLDDLEYLPAGDAKLTRRAKEYSGENYTVVVRFSRTRKRYERQGLLVQKSALQKASA